jgi:protoporphyrinogen/coproporphyrinogen III oxidase
MVVRRLGRSFLDYAIDPFISGIYAGNPQKLITKYAMPKLYNLEQNYGSFIKGAMKKKKENASIPAMKKVTKEVFSTELGLHNLVQSLVKCIGEENFELNASDIVVNSQSKPYTVTFEQNGSPITYNSEYVISTTAAHVLPSVFTDLPQDKLNKISNLEYAKVVQVVLGFTKWQGIELKSFGGLVPTVEKRNILGVLFISSIFRNRAPEGGALLSVFLGGMKRSDIIEMSDEEIMNIVKEELKLMLKTNTDEADLVKILRYSKAIPQYEVSSGERFKAIDEIQNEFAGIILAGNIRNGIGMSDRIAQGRQIADEIINKSKI